MAARADQHALGRRAAGRAVLPFAGVFANSKALRIARALHRRDAGLAERFHPPAPRGLPLVARRARPLASLLRFHRRAHAFLPLECDASIIPLPPISLPPDVGPRSLRSLSLPRRGRAALS